MPGTRPGMTNERPEEIAMSKRWEFMLAAAVAMFGSCAFAQASFAQDAVDLAKAKAEGKVVWYTSTPLPQAQKIVNMFEKEHGIKVEMFRSGGSAILRRFQQEIDAGRVAADVLTTSDPAAAAMLTRKGIFVPFKPKNFDKIPDAAKDKDGNFVAQRLNLMTNYIRADKVPLAALQHIGGLLVALHDHGIVGP